MFDHQRQIKVFLYVLLIAAYVFLISGVLFLLGLKIDYSNPLVTLLFVTLIAVPLPLISTSISQSINRSLRSKKEKSVQNERSFMKSFVQASSVAQITQLVQSFVNEVCTTNTILIYILDPKLGEYCLFDPHLQRQSDGVHFSAGSSLVRQLSEGHILELNSDDSQPLNEDQTRINLLSSRLIVPMLSENSLSGWLALGDLGSDKIVDLETRNSLEQICALAAMALQRVHSNDSLLALERELKVITRVAQGISFTAALDDILELISAQASQILPVDDYRITLYQASSKVHYHVFVLEGDERLVEMENTPISQEIGLEIEVIQSQLPLITDDYERECLERGQIGSIKGIFAWMGVPLNAGAETIGVISIASRSSEIKYHHDHLSMLQAIADLTAGAIVKSRLLEESQQRAAQLAKLNEISLELTSTLELKPLFVKILQNATQILHCVAGCLLVVDNQQVDVIVESVHGPVSQNVTGKRFPNEAGFPFYSILNEPAKIIHAGQEDLHWADEMLLDGLVVQSMLAIPMRIQDRVLGAIIVINKQDNSPFTQADQEWLTAFTNQATIAIENARLYTLTDQALAERVDELSVMQQIDRQLNASLEVESALQITLDWALKQSHAEAGLVGTIDDHGFRLIVGKGYPQDHPGLKFPDQENPNGYYLDQPLIQSVLSSGKMQIVNDLDAQHSQTSGFLDGVCSQVAIPVRRESQIIGLIFLESQNSRIFSTEKSSFLSRLSDHAAIALANAQLFAEIKEANNSKSRFVSFVAHELKNPMASIKGYTELVAGGMAGPVTDMQASFLATVRSNVDRMNTIVSDLNDLTKIQVGNLRLDCSPVNLYETLNDVTRSLQRSIDAKEQIIKQNLPVELPNVWADVARLSQILTNLISNATKYTQTSGVIAVGAETMPAIDPGSGDLVHVWVEDHGVGIPIEDQKKIFQPYFRTDLAKEMASGTGLGLNITRSLVELQGGEIWFESEPGSGTTFHFTIPVYRAA